MIPVNTTLSLRVTSGAPGPYYSSQVLGQSHWGLVLSIPHLHGELYPVPAGTQLALQFMEGNVMVEVRTQVVGYEQRTPPVMIVAAPHARVEKNRRGSLRFPVELPVVYVVGGDQVTFSKTRTIDLSHTGLLLWAPRPLTLGAIVSLVLEMPEYSLRTDSVVRRNIPKGPKCMIGVEFMKLRTIDAMQLHRFLVAMELERAKINRPEFQQI